VESVDDLARLKHLGVEELADTASASPSALIRALTLLGEQLSTEWGQEEILQVRGRWRLVRGAIQEIYRSLNQRNGSFDCPASTRFAARSEKGVEFQTLPLYYAEPGSTVEQAFLGALPLIDADRTYLNLFERLGITRLVPGETIEELFLAQDSSVPVQVLRDQIVNSLAPYLLAPIIAKSDRSDQSKKAVSRLRERFEVKVADHLTVCYSLKDDPSIEKMIEFPRFYLQRRLVEGPGAIREAHYTLYVAGHASISLFSPHLDADALGEALSSVLLETPNEELSGLFPRIASRYYHLQGQREAMEEYLYYQLGISKEAQDLALAMIAGETLEDFSVPSPPPARIVHRPNIGLGERADGRSIDEKLWEHRDKIGKEADGLMQGLAGLTERQPKKPGTTRDTPPSSPTPRSKRITPEQKARGRKGEEEIKRRLERPGGWEGFTLIEDRREQGCGYDFWCAKETREVTLEIKTYAPNGRVFVTSNELREAAVGRTNYHLVGVLDDGKPEHEWTTTIILDPIDTLLTEGTFDIEATLKASASAIFDEQQG
jgi:hypothetical protein